jgi:ABC-2 type transport system ATP-binding protein
LTCGARSPPGPRPAAEAIELVGLTDKDRVTVAQLSGGEGRRLELALAVLGRPELLFLDEPTTGMDPASRLQTWRVVRELQRGGTTIVLTTHYLEEAEGPVRSSACICS